MFYFIFKPPTPKPREEGSGPFAPVSDPDTLPRQLAATTGEAKGKLPELLQPRVETNPKLPCPLPRSRSAHGCSAAHGEHREELL